MVRMYGENGGRLNGEEDCGMGRFEADRKATEELDGQCDRSIE